MMTRLVSSVLVLLYPSLRTCNRKKLIAKAEMADIVAGEMNKK